MISVILGIFSYQSSSEILDAKKVMQEKLDLAIQKFQENINNTIDRIDRKVDKAVSDTENKTDKTLKGAKEDIEKLTGMSLKKPELKLLFENKDLNGLAVDFIYKGDVKRGSYESTVPEFILWNKGLRLVTQPTIYLYIENTSTSNYGQSPGYPFGDWKSTKSDLEGFDEKFVFHYRTEQIPLNLHADERWMIHFPNLVFRGYPLKIKCKFVIHFGEESSLISDFVINLKYLN